LEERIAEKGIEGKFDYLEHTADLYIRAYGRDLLELFSNAGLSIFESMTTTSSLEAKEKRSVKAEGYDLENLFYRWLEELLTLYYSEGLMCREVVAEELVIRRVNDDREYSVKGYCVGEIFDPERHESKVEIKAVTYHQMRIIRDPEKGWIAYFVLDI
jgi:SHS2 domain-containing protein